ncbi:MAG: DUF2304 domain-containing protein [Oscillospiraceae bacterium]
MSVPLRVILILGSVFTFFFVTHYIRKARIRIEDTIFWLFFCMVLIVISIFPALPFWLSELIGFQSPINLVYLIIIFILIVNQFYTSVKISQLEIKQKELVQKLAVDKAQMEKKEI